MKKKMFQKITFAMGLMLVLAGWGSSANAEVRNTNTDVRSDFSRTVVKGEKSLIEGDIGEGKSVNSNNSEMTPFYYGDNKEDYIEGDVNQIDYWFIDSYGTSHSVDYIGNILSEGYRNQLDFIFNINNYGALKDTYVGFELYYDINGMLEFQGTAAFEMTNAYEEWLFTANLDMEGIENQQYFYFKIGIAPNYESSYYSDVYCMRVTNPYYKNVTDGWLNTGFHKRYYKDGKPYTNQWINENGAWYYFNPLGNAVVNEVYNIDGALYIFDTNGVMLCKKGWNLIERYNFSLDKVEQLWYWGNGDGTVKNSTWQRVNSTWYYLDMYGVMKTGWLRLDSTYYYMNSYGAMTTGWQLVNGKWYYMDSYGAMQTGWERINNRWYYLRGSGEMATGWVKDNNRWYYLNAYGEMATGWLRYDNNWYYLNGYGEMATGWVLINSNWYYMYSSGVMATNTVIDGWKIDSYGIARQ